MNDVFKYRSVLAPYMNGLIAIKESQGFIMISMKWFFKEFDSFVIDYGLKDPVITQELVNAWRKSRINDCSRTLLREMFQTGAACKIYVRARKGLLYNEIAKTEK